MQLLKFEYLNNTILKFEYINFLHYHDNSFNTTVLYRMHVWPIHVYVRMVHVWYIPYMYMCVWYELLIPYVYQHKTCK